MLPTLAARRTTHAVGREGDAQGAPQPRLGGRTAAGRRRAAVAPRASRARALEAEGAPAKEGGLRGLTARRGRHGCPPTLGAADERLRVDLARARVRVRVRVRAGVRARVRVRGRAMAAGSGSKRRLGAAWVPLGGRLGVACGSLECPLGVSSQVLGCPGGCFGAPWGSLGSPSEVGLFGRPLGDP